jgi:hypothetical protein
VCASDSGRWPVRVAVDTLRAAQSGGKRPVAVAARVVKRTLPDFRHPKKSDMASRVLYTTSHAIKLFSYEYINACAVKATVYLHANIEITRTDTGRNGLLANTGETDYLPLAAYTMCAILSMISGR